MSDSPRRGSPLNSGRSWSVTSPDGKLSFTHPASWRVVPGERGPGVSGGLILAIEDEGKKIVARLACGTVQTQGRPGPGGSGPGLAYTVLDYVEVPLPYQPFDANSWNVVSAPFCLPCT